MKVNSVVFTAKCIEELGDGPIPITKRNEIARQLFEELSETARETAERQAKELHQQKLAKHVEKKEGKFVSTMAWFWCGDGLDTAGQAQAHDFPAH